MSASPRSIQVFKYNPPLRVLPALGDPNVGISEDFLFARPKLKRNIAHDRVSRYFQKSRNPIHSLLD